jgi:hypothetical protein
MGESFVLRSDPDFLEWENLMRFRLHYEGRLLAAKGDPRDGQFDNRAPHKHEIRCAFHGQLKHFWETHPWLSVTKMPWDMFGGAPTDELDVPFDDRTTLAAGLAGIHKVGKFGFVPLVCDQFKVLCGLKLLLLRRDKPGGVLNGRDLDNRLKIIFDALRMPRALNEFRAEDTENPMYVLLQDDSLISSVQIETDNLLDPPEAAGKDDSYVRLLVEVDIRPYFPGMFGIGFVAD